MSLDLYITSSKPVRHRGTGVFIRDNGCTRELKTLDEVKEHFPDADLSDVKAYDYEDDELFHMNLTHNLTNMAGHVPIEGTDGITALPRDFEKEDPDFKTEPLSAYNLLWHPETNPLLDNRTVRKKNEESDEEYDIEATFLNPELLRQVMVVYCYIATHGNELRQYNPKNGWGTYEQLLDATHRLLKALVEIPVEEYEEYYIYCWT